MRRVFARPELKTVIEGQGRTQSWIASRISVSRFLMSHIVAGRRAINVDQADEVAEILGLPLFLLFDVTDDTKKMTTGIRSTGTAA